MTVTDSMKEKIKKLLAMTTANGATEAEAQVAMSKAQELLKNHNLTFSEVENIQEKKDHREEERFPAYPWARQICSSVAHLYDCYYYYQKGEDLRKTNHIFVGRKSNAETSMLIAEFVVKTVLKESVKAQRERGLTNRFATDFAQGAAARISEKAYQLWRESNADKIKEQADINDARTKDRLAKKLDMNELKPGQYEFRLLDDDYIQKQDMKLNAENAMQTFKNMAANPPRGIYVVSVKCVEGEMASEHSFSWRIKQTKKKSVARDTVRDWDAYNTGRDAAENIGLRVQVGGSAPTESIQA